MIVQISRSRMKMLRKLNFFCLWQSSFILIRWVVIWRFQIIFRIILETGCWMQWSTTLPLRVLNQILENASSSQFLEDESFLAFFFQLLFLDKIGQLLPLCFLNDIYKYQVFKSMIEINNWPISTILVDNQPTRGF